MTNQRLARKKKLENALIQLTEVFNDSIRSCKHCGNSDSFFYCDECKYRVAEFADRIVDVINAAYPGEANIDLRIKLNLKIGEHYINTD